MTDTDLAVLARAEWPEPGDQQVPALPGFVLSTFNPLAAAVIERCLSRRHGQPPVPAAVGDRTAVILVSQSGDLVSAVHVARTVDAAGRVGPLFFYQSVPNSVLGHLAARWGLAGPVVCLCPVGDAWATALDHAALLIDDGDADEVLAVLVEQPVTAADQDHSAAMLLSRQPVLSGSGAADRRK